MAVNACRELNRPGLLLSTFPENFPPDLPETVRPLSYVSFSQLLPHCSAIVHHGGIGTTSQALAAGIPQLIRPLAFDQFDNASRVEKLGRGRWLRSDRNLVNDLGAILASGVDDAEKEGLKTGRQACGVDAAGVAAREVQRMVHQR